MSRAVLDAQCRAGDRAAEDFGERAAATCCLAPDPVAVLAADTDHDVRHEASARPAGTPHCPSRRWPRCCGTPAPPRTRPATGAHLTQRQDRRSAPAAFPSVFLNSPRRDSV
ncbi:hypothetical protein MOV08_39530 [Streptomyces yunnanensis]|uniref:Uncharacterized protein n=1 Tax=Streptomyces yunnanensis TaxID=156453 RepID=A0ABY8ALH9_9ACTN|nr:hypothetical protein [Streptomyces yunnanensis]WEB44775.1 hypothetical protein MOV08_39530 [Streptomyces yunnanensis]